MPTALYASLAASASVFIGILAAFLTSNISSLTTERNHIKRRTKAIDARLQSLEHQREQLHEDLEEVEEEWRDEQKQESATEDVDAFIEKHIGDVFHPSSDDITPERIESEFAEFLDVEVDNLNEYQQSELRNRYNEIKDKVTPTYSYSQNPLENIDLDSIPAKPGVYEQIEAQWEIHSQESYNRDYRQWIQTVTEMGALNRERSKLVDRYESLDPTQLEDSLNASVVTIVLSVVIPTIALLVNIVSTPTINIPSWIEPVSIFVIWALGLGYVFFHLRSEITGETDDLPEKPEILEDLSNEEVSEGTNKESTEEANRY